MIGYLSLKEEVSRTNTFSLWLFFFFIIDNSYIIANSLPEIIQGPEIHAEEFLSGCKFYL